MTKKEFFSENVESFETMELNPGTSVETYQTKEKLILKNDLYFWFFCEQQSHLDK